MGRIDEKLLISVETKAVSVVDTEALISPNYYLFSGVKKDS